MANKCKKCSKNLDKSEYYKCPTCGYIYCPECVNEEEKKDKHYCFHCEKVLEFFSAFSD